MMTRGNVRVVAVAVALLGSAATAGEARAEDDASAVAAARAIGTEGLKLAESGNCKDAIEKLDRAEKLHHAPTTLAKLGECHVQVGKLVVGTEELQRVVREPMAADAPPVFVAAKARAQKLVEETRPRFAQLHIKVIAPAGAALQVTVDNELVPVALLDVDRPTDPGPHTIEVTAPGYKTATAPVTLKEGERAPVQLTLEVDPNAPVATSPRATSSDAASPKQADVSTSDRSQGTMRIAGWTLIGVGAAGLVTGGVAALLASGTKSDLDAVCDSNHACPADQDSRISRLQTESTVGTIGLVVGAVGVVGGTALLFAAASGGSNRAETTLPAKRRTAAAPAAPTLSFGLASVGLRGEF